MTRTALVMALAAAALAATGGTAWARGTADRFTDTDCRPDRACRVDWDIQAGTYRTVGGSSPGRPCEWTRFSLGSPTTRGRASGEVVLDLTPGQLVVVTGCQEWVRDTPAPSPFDPAP